MMKWLPLWLVDKILLVLAWLVLRSMTRYGLEGPEMGPLELKNVHGKTHILDVRALSNIKVGPWIGRFTSGSQVELVDGQTLDVDPKMEFPNGWKGKAGLYAVGFTKRGLLWASSDASRIATDIGKVWKKEETKQKKRTTFSCHRRCISQY